MNYHLSVHRYDHPELFRKNEGTPCESEVFDISKGGISVIPCIIIELYALKRHD